MSLPPSLIPKKPGDKVKKDKRDALKLAKFIKGEELISLSLKTKPYVICLVSVKPAWKT